MSVALMNASIQKFVKLPSFQLQLPCDGHWRLGLAYNQCSDDYKVIAIMTSCTAIHSCNTDTWTRRLVYGTSTHGSTCDLCESFPIFLRGATHWIVKSDWQQVEIDPTHSIVS